MTTRERERSGAPSVERAGWRGDAAAVLAAGVLVAAAVVVGVVLVRAGVPLLVGAPPFLAQWMPHVGPGTVPAVLVAVVVALRGPELAARWSWRSALGATWAASLAWTMSLALVDGFTEGFAGRLTTLFEYLHEVPRITDIPAFLSGFAALIPSGQPGFWTTHVAGHPPLATLVFVWLDRIGLGGGVWASSLVVLVGSSAAVAVAITLRALGAPGAARAFLPYGVLFPGAVWAGVSADGMFAAVLAWAVAALAVGAARRGRTGAAIATGGGVLLGASLYLSYGLVSALLVPLAALGYARAWRPALAAIVGAGAVAAVFTTAGFWWLDGYHQLLIRYAQPGEFGALRPYGYFVWANLAVLVVVVGPATVAGLRRLAATPRAPELRVAVLLCAATLVAVGVADLSGLSKGETERIWLPFAVWLLAATAALPRPPRPSARAWLLAQAAVALAINHLLLTVW